jgi:hypothetical protein
MKIIWQTKTSTKILSNNLSQFQKTPKSSPIKLAFILTQLHMFPKIHNHNVQMLNRTVSIRRPSAARRSRHSSAFQIEKPNSLLPKVSWNLFNFNGLNFSVKILLWQISSTQLRAFHSSFSLFTYGRLFIPHRWVWERANAIQVSFVCVLNFFWYWKIEWIWMFLSRQLWVVGGLWL